LNDTGLYTCLAENKIGFIKKEIHIDVLCTFWKWKFRLNKKIFCLLVPPSIVDNGQMINEIIKLKGESLVLTCLLHAIPLPTIIWTKNDQILFDSERLGKN